MGQYIDKDALVAEIDRLDEFYHLSKSVGGQAFIESLFSSLDTFEAKEVDLEKEVDDWYNTKASKEFENVLYRDIEKCAKHFFELGMAVSNKAQKKE